MSCSPGLAAEGRSLPVASHNLTEVELTSPAGVRPLWALPVFAFFVSAVGIGLAGLIPRPGVVVGAVLLWKFGVEQFTAMLPVRIGKCGPAVDAVQGRRTRRGQYPTIQRAFGSPNGALAFFAFVATAFFVLGTVRLSRRDLTTD